MSRAGRGAKGRPFEFRLLENTGPQAAPLYAQLYRQLRDHILTGALGPGARLPSARMMASDLDLSRNTVEAAYMQLQSEGFIERRVGTGTMVAASVTEVAPFRGPPALRDFAQARPTPPVKFSPPVVLSDRGRLLSELGCTEIQVDQRSWPCATDVHGIPLALWNRLVARQARRGGVSLLRHGDPQGHPLLRQAIAEHARLTRGVQCDASQVVVVNSTQQAIDLATRLLLDPGQRAFVEEPGYPSGVGAFLGAGAVIHPVPVDEDGLMTDQLPRDAVPALLYVTPSHQFPLGVTMALARRLAALRWAAETGSWILEDDYDSEFRYDGRPIAALQGLDRAGRVLYLGTYNKVLFPGLRLAYLIVPGTLVDPFVGARRLIDGAPSPLLQSVLAEFLTGGYLAAHLRQARQHNTLRRDRLFRAIETHWGAAVRLGPAGTGLHLVCHLEPGVDDDRITRSATPGAGLSWSPLSRYYAGQARRSGLVLSYGASVAEEIESAVAALVANVTRPSARPR